LSFDTSGDVGAVAVGQVVVGSGVPPEILASVAIEQRREQAARLVPAVDEALATAHVKPDQVAGIVVGEGPGSFTGVRIAAATAKGLAHVWDVPLWAASSLAGSALTHEVGPIRYVLFDARADRVYGACYGVGRAGVQELVPPHGGTLRDALAGDVPGGAVFVGEGARRHRAAIEGAGFPVSSEGGGASIAAGLLASVALGVGAGVARAVASSSWEPTYVRPWSPEPSWST